MKNYIEIISEAIVAIVLVCGGMWLIGAASLIGG